MNYQDRRNLLLLCNFSDGFDYNYIIYKLTSCKKCNNNSVAIDHELRDHLLHFSNVCMTGCGWG